MYQLTIDHASVVTISGHSDFDAAYRALLDYVVGADYYLCAVEDSRPHTRYELIKLSDIDDYRDGDEVPDRRPLHAGHAFIEEAAVDPDVVDRLNAP